MSQSYYQNVSNASTDQIAAQSGPYGNGFQPDVHKPLNRKRWLIIGGIVGLLVLVGIGVGVGVGVSRATSNKSASGSTGSSSSSNSDSSSSNSDSGSGSNSEAANFPKDENLKQSFYGLSYTPENSLYPDCGNNLESVIKDIQLISQLTTRIRLYGSDCNQSALVLEAIRQTNTDVHVYLANYVLPDDDAAYQRQKTALQDAIKTYGTDHIEGITVGNEFMLNYLTANGATDPNSAVGNTGASILMGYITDTRQMLSDLGVSLEVGTSDAGSFFNTEVLGAVEFGLSNVHPWFANTTIEDAATWTWTFFQETNVAAANALANRPKMYIAETGWPSKSSDAANANNGASEASVANLQIFLDTFVCQANSNGTGYFYFEFSDEPWKDEIYGGVEGWWGLFNSDRTLKSITIPEC